MTLDADRIPHGWRIARLGEVAEIVRGISWTREQESPTPDSDAVPVVRIGNVQPDGFHMDDMLYIRDVGETDRARGIISPGTLVMVGSNGNRDRVGNVFLSDERVVGHLLASFLIAVRPVEDASERFLAAVLRSARIQRVITDSTAGSTGLKNLGLRWLRSLPILLPPLPEQRAIAAVLDGIDAAIERTEEVIAATERVRDALLHELLTRGLPGRHSEWVEVPGLGTVPACWDVVRLGEVAKFRSGFGARSSELQPRSQAYPFPVYGGNGIAGYWPEPLVEHRVVVIGRVGQKCGVVLVTDGPAWITDNALYNEWLTERVTTDFLALVTARAGLNDIRNRNELPLVTQQIVHSVRVALPSPTEQLAIVDALDGVDGAIDRAREERARLHSLQASAADALLTGRVRISEASEVTA